MSPRDQKEYFCDVETMRRQNRAQENPPEPTKACPGDVIKRVTISRIQFMANARLSVAVSPIRAFIFRMEQAMKRWLTKSCGFLPRASALCASISAMLVVAHQYWIYMRNGTSIDWGG